MSTCMSYSTSFTDPSSLEVLASLFVMETRLDITEMKESLNNSYPRKNEEIAKKKLMRHLAPAHVNDSVKTYIYIRLLGK